MPSIDALDLPKKYTNTYIRARQKGNDKFITVYVSKISVCEECEDDKYSFYCVDRDKNNHIFTQDDEFFIRYMV